MRKSNPQPPEERESGGGSPSAGRFLQFFNKNNAFLCIYFGQNSYFKATAHQLEAFKISLNVLHRINEVQVL